MKGEIDEWSRDPQRYKVEAGSFTDRMNKYLDFSYLVVVRVLAYEPPILEHYGGPTGKWEGSVELEVFIVDLQSVQVMCSFEVSTESGDSVSYDPEAQDAQENLYENLATQARNAIKTYMSSLLCRGPGAFEPEP